jgi:predicted 3-demethylubiquinone-9 3-methyltransferase (glyoxalase superfamily)
VEFIQCGQVTRGQFGRMPESHRQARDFLAARAGMPPLSKLSAGGAEDAEQAHALTLRVRDALTELAEFYHQRLLATPSVLAWFREKYGISDEMAARLKIGFAANMEPSVIQALINGPSAFTKRELAATSAFRPTAQDGLVPFFDGRIVFPYWSRGRVVFMIGRQTPWTPDQSWEKSKYKKLAVQNDRDGSHVAPCISNDVLFNEDVLLTRPERVILTEGVTDCISLMEHGFPTFSPVTVQIREADWARLLPKLAGVKTVYICQDNEISEAGMKGAMRTARTLAENGIRTRLAVLPLGEKQQNARRELRERFGVEGSVTPRELAKLLEGKDQDEIQQAHSLLAAAKIDVNEYFATGKSAADFEEILSAAQTPLELAISKLSTDNPDHNLSRALEPILAEVGRLDPIEQDRHLRLIQARCGKERIPVGTLRRQLKVVEIDRKARPAKGRSYNFSGSGGAQPVPINRTQLGPLPDIQLNNRQLLAVIADAWSAVHAANQIDPPPSTGKPFLFQCGGALVRIAEADDGPTIDHMNETSMYGVLARSANWNRIVGDLVVATSPSKDAARDMLVNPDTNLPHLESLIRTPAFGKDGCLISSLGYHATDRLWLFSDASLKVPEVPAEPTADQITAARSLLLDDLFVDFPFVTPSDRAHAVAAIILPFIRRMIDGATPIHLVEAPTMGSGKGLLTNLISIVTTGVACDVRTMPEHEDDVRKMLTAELIKGRPIILLDNVSDKRKLDSTALAAIVTSPRWTDRFLGESRMVTVPNNALWLMTGNNPKLSDEMPRRCVRVRIDPRVDRPWLRAKFKHTAIADWAKQNRSALVHAVLTLVQAWIAAGQPLHPVPLGSFEAWSAILGGVLGVAQIPGFLGNLDELYETADTDGQMWREFTGAWWDVFHGEPQKASDLNRLCEERDLMLNARGDGSPRSQQTRLGKALGNKRDRVFDSLAVKRVILSKHKGAVLYALTPVNGDVDPAQSDQSSLDLIDSIEFGDVGDVENAMGTLVFKRPHDLSAIETATSKDNGDVGDVLPMLRAEIKNTHIPVGEIAYIENSIVLGAATGPNVPNVPMTSTTNTKETPYLMGTFADDVPMTSPTSPSTNRPAIDLANLPEEWDAPDRDPP